MVIIKTERLPAGTQTPDFSKWGGNLVQSWDFWLVLFHLTHSTVDPAFLESSPSLDTAGLRTACLQHGGSSACGHLAAAMGTSPWCDHLVV